MSAELLEDIVVGIIGAYLAFVPPMPPLPLLPPPVLPMPLLPKRFGENARRLLEKSRQSVISGQSKR